ncbi:MAG: glycosyl transferase family 2 [Anaerocolumna sp.]|jgi:dolichol-phosphate mannosyltransferase|nr:glycosyl transferase family 2 [Anaerocolumna sp.]
MNINNIITQKGLKADTVLSIVIPIFEEGSHILNTVSFINTFLQEQEIKHKFILIDDGSKDNTWEQLLQLTKSLDNILAIRLTRNFGKESAICAGLDLVDTPAAIIMDGDLQHPPQIIPQMFRLWRDEGIDVVEGVKKSRGREGFLYHLSARLFYKLIFRTSKIDISDASDFKLLDHKVIEAWKQMPERTTFFRGMSAWVGFKRTKIEFDVAKRVEGKSKWSPLRLLKLAIGAITSYTTIPLHFITVMGLLMFMAFIIIGIQTIYMKLSGQALNGFTTVILLLLVIGSSVMVSLGIIGIYISKIYHEVKARPRYLISESVQGGEDTC